MTESLPKAPTLGRKKVMVVDDDPDVRAMVRIILERSDYRVLEEASGQSLLRRIFDEDVSLVLLDIMMPGMDGITVCRSIRRNIKLEKIMPIIMLTAKDDRETVMRAVKAGADDYIVKPFSPETLLEKVNKHVK